MSLAFVHFYQHNCLKSSTRIILVNNLDKLLNIGKVTESTYDMSCSISALNFDHIRFIPDIPDKPAVSFRNR